MDVIVILLLFLMGALGALLAIYIGKQELVPEFRPIIDVSDKMEQAKKIRELLENTQKDIDCWEKMLTAGDTSSELATHLSTGIDKSFEELKYYRDTLKPLQASIDLMQALSRVIGFFIYIIMGGVFAVFLARIITIDGINFGFSMYVVAFVIGTAWTSYLSTLGIKLGQDKADQLLQAIEEKSSQELVKNRDRLINAMEQIHTVETRSIQQLTGVRENIVDQVSRMKGVGKGATPAAVELDPAIIKAVQFNFDKTASTLKSDFDFTRKMVHRDLKGVL